MKPKIELTAFSSLLPSAGYYTVVVNSTVSPADMICYFGSLKPSAISKTKTLDCAPSLTDAANFTINWAPQLWWLIMQQWHVLWWNLILATRHKQMTAQPCLLASWNPKTDQNWPMFTVTDIQLRLTMVLIYISTLLLMSYVIPFSCSSLTLCWRRGSVVRQHLQNCRPFTDISIYPSKLSFGIRNPFLI